MKRSCVATTRSRPVFRNRSTCWSRKCARSASTSICTIRSSNGRARVARPRKPRSNDDGPRRTKDRQQRATEESADPSVAHRLSFVRGQLITPHGEDYESRDYESFQPAGAGSGLRPDPDFDREPGKDYVLVLRRDQKAGNDQLPDLQTRARRLVLRAHLRADQGLRMLVRQVQAHEVQGHHLREMLGRGHAVARAARAHGPYRARGPGRPHLVPQVVALAHRPPPRYDAEGSRADPLLRIL